MNFMWLSCHSRMEFTPNFDIFLEWAPILPEVLPLIFWKSTNQKLKYCNLKQATFAYFCLFLQQNSENMHVAEYKLQYFNFGLVNFQKHNSSCSREDGSSFRAHLERTYTTNNTFSYEMRTLSIFMLSVSYFARNGVLIFFL